MTRADISALKVRLHGVAYGTTFLDVRADILAAITLIDETDAALAGLIEHAMPSNWGDDDDPDQVAAWLKAFAVTDLQAAAVCINHPDRPVRETLDGDALCQECCDQWARNEGNSQEPDDASEASLATGAGQ